MGSWSPQRIAAEVGRGANGEGTRNNFLQWPVFLTFPPLQTAASERSQHLHDTPKLDLDEVGRNPCGDQILAEPTFQAGRIHVAGLFKLRGARLGSHLPVHGPARHSDRAHLFFLNT